MSKYEIVRFEDVLTIKNGKNQDNVENPNGKYPIYGSGGIMGYADDFICPENTVIIGRKGNINKPIFVSEKFWNVDTAFGLVAHPQKLFPKYLYYFCDNYDFERLNTTVTIPSLTKSNLLKINICMPNLETQKKIADVLDKMKSLIDLRKKQIEKMDLLIKSKFIEMFGDPVTNSKNWGTELLGQLGDLNRGISKHRPRNDPSLLGGIYPLIQTGEVANANLYINRYTRTYSDIGLKQSKMWPKGTLCITIAANIARTTILGFDACFPDSVVGFLSNKKTNNIYIYYWFSFFQKILEKQAPESAQKNINLKILNELYVVVPPVTLQNQFASFVESVEKQKHLLQQALDKMGINYKSLMQEYFG